MKTDKIKARIEDRKARGLTASQYTELIARNLANAQQRCSRAVRSCTELALRRHETAEAANAAYDSAQAEYEVARAELLKAQADQESGICSF